MPTTTTQTLAARRWYRIIPVVFITYSLAYLDRANIGFGTAGGMAADLHITPSASSLISALFFLGYFFFQIPGVYYAANKSARHLIFWSLILWGLCAMATGMVTVYYDGYHGTVIDPGFDTVLKVAHKVTAGWNNEGGIVNGTQTAGTVTTMSGINSWGAVTLGSNYYLFNLPVELSGFTAGAQHCNVTLAWTTETETELVAFDVQYSTDGSNFATLESIAPKGNHSTYTYTHTPAQGRSYYRLRLRMQDGSYAYSMVLVVNMNCNDHSVTVYPNPVTSGEDLHVALTGYNGDVRAILYDINGRMLTVTNLVNGPNLIHTDLLSAGNYELGIISKENGREVYKIVVYR